MSAQNEQDRHTKEVVNLTLLKVAMQIMGMVKQLEEHHRSNKIGCPIARVSLGCFTEELEEKLGKYFEELVNPERKDCENDDEEGGA